MADLQIKSIYLRNWARYAEAAVQFPDSGLVVITGPIGVGKSSLAEAVNRAVLGVPGRFVNLRQYSTDKGGNTYVKVEALFKGKPMLVEIGYKCKELNPLSEGLRYTYQGQVIERGKLQETRDDLARLLSISPQLAEWTIFVDSDRLKFNRMSEAETVQLLMAALAQPPWTQYYESARETLRVFKQEQAAEEANHGHCQRRLQEAKEGRSQAQEALAKVERSYQERLVLIEHDRRHERQTIAALTQQIEEAQARQKEIAAEVDQAVEASAERDKNLEIERNAVNDAIYALREKRDKIVQQRAAENAEFNAQNTSLSRLSRTPKECPTCKKPWDTAVSAQEIKKQEQVVTQAGNLVKKSAQRLLEIDAKIAERNRVLQAAEKKLREQGGQQVISALGNEHRGLEADVRDALRQIHEGELRLKKTVDDSDVLTARATFKERERVYAENQEALTAAAQALATVTSSLKVIEYWSAAFSPNGISNMVLQEVIAPLNQEARRISATLSGAIEVSFAASRQLASGLDRMELTINVDNKNGSKDLAGSSKGEAGLSNFIISESLAEIGQISRRVGYKFLDEVLPNQDPQVCHRIYRYLNELAKEKGALIFLIDHNPIALDYADYFLNVTKNNSGTSLKWEAA